MKKRKSIGRSRGKMPPPTRAHSTPRGQRGYDRRRGKQTPEETN